MDAGREWIGGRCTGSHKIRSISIGS